MRVYNLWTMSRLAVQEQHAIIYQSDYVGNKLIIIYVVVWVYIYNFNLIYNAHVMMIFKKSLHLYYRVYNHVFIWSSIPGDGVLTIVDHSDNQENEKSKENNSKTSNKTKHNQGLDRRLVWEILCASVFRCEAIFSCLTIKIIQFLCGTLHKFQSIFYQFYVPFVFDSHK